MSCSGKCSSNTDISNPTNCGSCGTPRVIDEATSFKRSSNMPIDPNAVYISVSKLKLGDLYELLKFAFFADKQETINAFLKAGVRIEDVPAQYKQQLEFLAWLGNSGADRAGKLRGPGEVPVHFSVRGVYDTIDITASELVRSNIVFIA